MGESPLTGFGEMRNVDLYSAPGVAKTNMKLQLSSQTPVNATFTADPATDLLTFASSPNLSNGAAITVSSSGTLPNPLVANTTYYVIFVGTNTIKLATNLGNLNSFTAINITTAGTGVLTATTINLGRVTHFTENPVTNYVYCVDDNGRVWYVGDFANLWVLIDGNDRTNARGNGICVWKNYLLVFRNNKIDLYGGPAGGLSDAIANRVWNVPAGWPLNATNTSGSHHAVWGIDDILYYCDKNLISDFQEVGTFTGAAGTYTQTVGALVLPTNYESFRLRELGQNLEVLANIGSNSTTSTIFPWDRSSTSFFLPLELFYAANNFLSYNNTMYIFSTRMMKIFASNGSFSNAFKRLPPAIALNDSSFNTSIGGVGVYNGKMFFTIYGRTGYAGLFSINLDGGDYNQQNALVFENIIANESTTTTISLPGLHVPRNAGNMYVSWYDSSLGYGGIDSYLGLNNTYPLYDNFETVIESPLYKVGTTLVQNVYSQVEIALANPLTASQSIRLSYRTNVIDAYTLIGTFDSTDKFSGNRSSMNFVNAPNNLEYFQVKCELKTSSSASPQLIEIRFRE